MENIYTVVVADDEDELREALCAMLPWEKLGFRLAGDAANGLEALELVERLEPDLLITDIQMPFISGIDLARQVREIRPAIHIVFLSGYDDFEYAQQAIEYNIIRYLLKPITREKMERELAEIHQKMDDHFDSFRRALRAGGREAEGQNSSAGALEALLPSLILDDDPEGECSEEELRREASAAGLFGRAGEQAWFVVAVLRLTGPDGEPVSGREALGSMDQIAGKYFTRAGFCSRARVIMLLMGNPGDFDEYLHILADEWFQVCDRAVGVRCAVGLSRRINRLSQLHGAYREAVEALKAVRPEQGGVSFFSDLSLSGEGTGPQRRGGEWLCRQALSEIERRYREADLSLASLSSLLNVSPNHLSVCIKKYAGEGFLNLLIRRRMEAARELLETTSLRVAEVAERCGYTDQHYFSYCFKKHFGASPNALRQRRGKPSAKAEEAV